MTVFGDANKSDYPLCRKRPKLETLREIPHLRPRTNLIGAVTRIRNNLAFATHEYFQKRGMLYIHTPLITASDCEGAGELFQVTTTLPEPHQKATAIKLTETGQIDYTEDFFKKPSFLTCSGQLNVEFFNGAVGDCYTFGPTFRAEESNTKRHLAEFWMIEPELAFADLKDDMDCAEEYTKYCLKYILLNNKEDLAFIDKFGTKGNTAALTHIVESDFKRITYTEAIKQLQKSYQKAKFEFEPHWGIDLASEHEKFLCEKVYKKPTIVYNYPKGIKAFYMRLNEDNMTVGAMDVLVPRIGELIGGSVREERYDVLVERILESNLKVEDYAQYLDLRKYGTIPHCGFGLGFERLVMLATGMENIRDVIPFPRYPGHADC